MKFQRDVNAMHHKVTCRRVVESVSQKDINVRKVRGVLREANAMMKVVTKSNTQFVQSDLMSSEGSSHWMQATNDRHNAAKHRAEDKVEEMGGTGPGGRSYK